MHFLFPTCERGAASLKSSYAFYRNHGKRLFDVVCSAIGLVILSPVLVLIALLVKTSSSGPFLFAQERVGRDGRTFKLLKFRSMVTGADKQGPGITARGDSRVTPIGVYLRRWKLDELPQLWNVMMGDMSLVGPRPELKRYVDMYTPEQRKVLMVRPGITDLASIEYRREEELLATAKYPEEFYVNTLFPQKLCLNGKYISCMSFWNDLVIIFVTLKLFPYKDWSRRLLRSPNGEQ